MASLDQVQTQGRRALLIGVFQGGPGERWACRRSHASPCAETGFKVSPELAVILWRCAQ